ncbi:MULTISPECIES: hypothetical protein [Cysteiniphilum]|uniref:hypothetical protein n=1 Tax=Cysteiniphilum TaxID=2056696 RepID=UPI001783A488|nr:MULTISPECIES: hypothetical protein [Cysteiniphilum]
MYSFSMDNLLTRKATLILFSTVITTQVFSQDLNHQSANNTQEVLASNSKEANYIKQMDLLNKQMQLSLAQNALLTEQLKTQKLKSQISQVMSSKDTNQSTAYNSNYEDHNAYSKSLFQKQQFQLVRISGPLNNLTALIAFNDSRASVKAGANLTKEWMVGKVTDNNVYIINKLTNDQVHLYLTDNTFKDNDHKIS